MPHIIIKNLNSRKIFSDDTEKKVLTIIHENRIDWMHACGAKGKCTSCKMITEAGGDHLSELTEPEIKYRKEGRLKNNERLSCQATLKGDIAIRVAERNKFPHVNYSD